MQVTGCRLGGQHFDVDEVKHTPTKALVFNEDKRTLVFSRTGLNFSNLEYSVPPFIDHLAANYLAGKRSD